MKKILVVSAVVFLIVFLVVFFGKKNEKAEGNKSKSPELPPALPPPAPMPPTSGNINSTGGNTQQVFDTNIGEGADAIRAEVSKLIASSYQETIRRESNIGGNLFSGVQNQKVKDLLTSYVRSQFDAKDDFEIPISCQIVSSEFVSQLNEIEKFGKEAKANMNNLQRQKFGAKLVQLADFTQFGLFTLLPSYDKTHSEFVEGSKTWGKCKKTLTDERECYKTNWKKLAAELAEVAKVMKRESDKLNAELKRLAIQRLETAGWKFHKSF